MTGDAVVREVGRPKVSWWQVPRIVLLLWHTTDGRQHYATVDGGGADTRAATTLSSGPEAEALDAELRAYEARGLPGTLPVGAIQGGLFIAGSVLFLWALVSATDPVIGTKWFWFWFVPAAPLGLGLLWWLARERPWSPRAPGREKRLTGWVGVGLGFLSGLAVSLLVWGLSSLFGDALLPIPR